eukprot:403348349
MQKSQNYLDLPQELYNKGISRDLSKKKIKYLDEEEQQFEKQQWNPLYSHQNQEDYKVDNQSKNLKILDLNVKQRAARSLSQLKSMQHIKSFTTYRRCIGNHTNTSTPLIQNEREQPLYIDWSQLQHNQEEKLKKKKKNKFRYDLVQMFLQPLTPKQNSQQQLSKTRIRGMNEFDSNSLYSKFQNFCLTNKDQKKPVNQDEAISQQVRIQKAIESSQKVFKANISDRNFINERKRMEEAIEKQKFANIDFTTRGDLKKRMGRIGRLKRVQQELNDDDLKEKKQTSFESFDRQFTDMASQLESENSKIFSNKSPKVYENSQRLKAQTGNVQFIIAPQMLSTEITIFQQDDKKLNSAKFRNLNSRKQSSFISNSKNSSPRSPSQFSINQFKNQNLITDKQNDPEPGHKRSQSNIEQHKIEEIIQQCTKNQSQIKLLKLSQKKHEFLDQKRTDVQYALKYLEEQNEEPQLQVKENLEVNMLIEEQVKFRKSNFELFGAPDVLSRFRDTKDKSTIFISKNGQKKIWKGQRLSKKVLDIVQEVN